MENFSDQFKNLFIQPRRTGKEPTSWSVLVKADPPETGFVIIDLITIIEEPGPPAAPDPSKTRAAADLPFIFQRYYGNLMPHGHTLAHGSDIWLNLTDHNFNPEPSTALPRHDISIQIPQQVDETLLVLFEGFLFIVRYDPVMDIQADVRAFKLDPLEKSHLHVDSVTNTLTILIENFHA